MMQPTFRRFHRLPDVVSGAPLNHFVGIIIPEETTNLVTNPSIETATTNYTAVGGSIARSAVKQYHGTYSLAITPTAATTDGAYYGTVTLTAAATYTLSCKFWGLPGVKYKISFATTGGVDLAVKPFIGTGRWQWMWVTYTDTSGGTRRLYFTKNTHTSTGVFYVDGVQVEAKAYPTTYCDGDEDGLLIGQQPPAYIWTGTPHASTSTRSALTRAGGKVVNIRTAYGFLLTGLFGLGLAVPNNVSVPYTVLDGARWQRTTKPPRTISLAGRFQGATRGQIDRARSDMRAAVDRDLVPLQQPLMLMIEPRDDCGEVSGDFITIPCIYAGGLEGNDTSALAEDAAPTFTMYLPYLMGGDGGAALTVQLSVSNANYFAMRTATGTWQILGSSGANATVRAIAIAPNGDIYVGGDFTDFGGSGADYIARWDGSAWNTVGGATALNNTVYALAFGPSGILYVGGAFTNAGGNASADAIATWDGATWGNLSTGAALPVLALAVTAAGNLYAGGQFASIGGSTADNIAYWNGSAWSNLASDTAINSTVYTLTIKSNGILYVGGAFTNANGIANADRIASWNGTAWAALSTGADNNVLALAVGPDGAVYAGGQFTVIGGTTTTGIARWNGTSWNALGSGIYQYASSLSFVGNRLYVGGTISLAGGISVPDGFAVWTGSSWVYADVDFPGAPEVDALVATSGGAVYAGFNTTGTATAAAVTAVTNDAPGYVWPKLIIKGPSSGTSRIYQIVNYTTGFGVWLNLTLNAGETATFNFDPQALSFTTTFQGDVTNTILPGSNPALMYLAPGTNNISFYAAASTVTATLRWQRRYNGLADLVN